MRSRDLNPKIPNVSPEEWRLLKELITGLPIPLPRCYKTKEEVRHHGTFMSMEALVGTCLNPDDVRDFDIAVWLLKDRMYRGQAPSE